MSKFTSDIMTMTLVINGDKSRLELKKLEKSTKELTREMNHWAKQGTKDLDKMYSELTKVEQALKDTNTKNKRSASHIEKLEQKMRKLNREITNVERAPREFEFLQRQLKETEKQMDRLRGKIDINTMSHKELRDESKRLRMELDAKPVNSKEYEKFDAALTRVQERMRSVKNGFHKLSKEYDINAISIEEIETRIRQLRMEMKKLPAGQKLNKIKKEINDLRNQSNRLKYSMTSLNETFDMTGASIKELQNRQRLLRTEMERMRPNDARLKKYRSELKKIETRANMLSSGLSRARLAFQRFTMAANNYQTVIAGVSMAIYGFAMSIQNMFRGFAEMSDVLGKVRKTTGMTQREVLSLKKTFREIDTRTSSKELLEITYIAGKLGIKGRNNLIGFSKAVDVLTVAMGGALGENIEEVTNTVGKLMGVFELDKQMGVEKGMLAITNVLNELGKRSKANEKDIVNFSRRLSGTAKTAGLTYDELLAVGAAISDLGGPVEMSATAFGRFMFSLGEDTEHWSRMIGVSVERYNEMINKDLSSVIYQVLKAAGKNGKGLKNLNIAFENLGAEGVRMKQVLGLLASNIDVLGEQFAIAKQEAQDQTSAFKEFNIMQDTFAGKMKRARKDIMEVVFAFLLHLQPAVEKLVYGLRSLVQWLEKNKTFLGALVRIAWTAAKAYATYWAAVKLTVFWQKLSTLWTNRHTIAQRANLVTTNLLRRGGLLLAAAWQLLTGRIRNARAAMIKFNRVSKANAFGILLTGVLLLLPKIKELIKQTNRAKEIQKEITKEYDNSRVAASVLMKKLKLLEEQYKNNGITENQYRKEKRDLINELNNRYGKYLTNLFSESDSIDTLTGKYKELNAELLKSAKLKVYEDAIYKSQQKIFETEQKIKDAQERYQDSQNYQTRGRLHDLIEKYREEINTLRIEQQELLSERGMTTLDKSHKTPNTGLFNLANTRNPKPKTPTPSGADPNTATGHYQSFLQSSFAFMPNQQNLSPVQLSSMSPLIGDNFQNFLQGTLSFLPSRNQQQDQPKSYPPVENTHDHRNVFQSYKNSPYNDIIEWGSGEKVKDDATNEVKEQIKQYNSLLKEARDNADSDAEEIVKVYDVAIERIETGLLKSESAANDDIKAREAERTKADMLEQQYQWQKYKETADGKLAILRQQLQSEEIAKSEYRDRARNIYNEELEAQKTADRKTAILRQMLSEQLITEKEFAKKRKQIYAAERQQRLLGMAEMFGGMSELAGVFAEDSKAFALFQIGLDTASAIASIAKHAEAVPTNAVTFGASGLAYWFSGLARIFANMKQAKKIISAEKEPKVSQYAWGKYNVFGADDNELYQNVPYIGAPKTGFRTRPALFAEQGGEVIFSNKDIQKPVVMRLVRQAIAAAKMPQYRDGQLETAHNTTYNINMQNVEVLLSEMLNELKSPKKNFVDINEVEQELAKIQEQRKAVTIE